MILYLGDFNIEEPMIWTIGEAPLKLVPRQAKAINPLYAVSYEPKPEIKVTFRIISLNNHVYVLTNVR